MGKMQEKSPKLSKKQNAVQVIKFALFSCSAGIIQTVSFTLLNELMSWSYWPSYLIALILSVLWNFTLNRKFTFKSASNVPIAMLKVALFYCVFTPLSTIGGEAVTNAAFWSEQFKESGWVEYIVLGGTMVINLVTEFFYQKYVVFRDTAKTTESAKNEDNAQ